MLPITDFNFMFCSIATVAAGVGYAFTRKPEFVTPFFNNPERMPPAAAYSLEEKLTIQRDPGYVAPSGSGTTNSGEGEAGTRRDSLKRKVPHDGFDEPSEDAGYPFNLNNIYPSKRRRTPPSREASEEPSQLPRDRQPWIVLHGNKRRASAASSLLIPRASSPSPRQGTDTPVESMPREDETKERRDSMLTDDAILDAPAQEPPRTPSPAPGPARGPNDVVIDQLDALPSATEPVVQPIPQPEIAQPEAKAPAVEAATVAPAPAPVTRPATPVSSTPKFGSSSKPTPSGFAAFAGAASPFASVGKSPFGSTSSLLLASRGGSVFGSQPQPAWNLDGISKDSANAEDILGSQVNDQESTLEPAFGESSQTDKGEKKKHAIDAAAMVGKAQAEVARVTGEESEDVEHELKGLKLYVKRGNKPFASGMVGTLKLLSDKKSSGERLLFRREPLWQVSMNIKISPIVRCTYEAEENALRLVLKEPIAPHDPAAANSSDPSALEIVVYALKPGRACSKQDFKEFAELLVKNKHFQLAKQPEQASSGSPATPATL